MINMHDLLAGFRSLPIGRQPVIAHASFKSLGKVQGGPRAVIDALIQSSGSLVMPAFTYQTRVIPEVGPPNNALNYGSGPENVDNIEGIDSTAAVPFTRALPVDKQIGILAETLRRHPSAKRTSHPILSFCGVNADFALSRQTLLEPFAPIGELAEKDGWVVLLGVDHTVNTSVHYAERLAGREGFVRWALMKPDAWPEARPEDLRLRIVQCPNFPGDSAGFDVLSDILDAEMDSVTIGEARVQAIRLKRLIDVVQTLIKNDPLALLCPRPDCLRCGESRKRHAG